MLHEVGVLGEVVLLAVLEDEDTVVLQERQSLVRYLGKGGEGVWRVGKDEVELLAARLEEAEDVAAHQGVVERAELLHALAYEVGVVAVHLHANHFAATA